MAKFTGISELNFYGMAVDMAAVGETQTDVNMRPRLGPLASLDYAPTSWRYLLALSAAATQGSVTIELLADTVVVSSQTIALNGNSTISNRVDVPVSAVSGAARLSVNVSVTGAGQSGLTGIINSVVSVEQPLVFTGC